MLNGVVGTGWHGGLQSRGRGFKSTPRQNWFRFLLSVHPIANSSVKSKVRDCPDRLTPPCIETNTHAACKGNIKLRKSCVFKEANNGVFRKIMENLPKHITSISGGHAIITPHHHILDGALV